MREMLRIKRSVQAMYNTQVNMMSAQILNNTSNQVSDIPLESTISAMRLLDNKVTSNTGNKN
jgi:pre-mRNA-splicing factor SYF1